MATPTSTSCSLSQFPGPSLNTSSLWFYAPDDQSPETSISISSGWDTCLGDVDRHCFGEFSRREIGDVVWSAGAGVMVITQRVDGKLNTK